MTKWEYKFEDFGRNLGASEMIKINKLGKDGWEMVSFTTVGYSREGDSSNSYEIIFKRPIK